MSTRAQLLCRTGPAAGASFRLGDVSRLGRDPGNEVYIPYQGLSRLHATITFANGTFWLEDAGSTNGTALNGRRIKKERLYNLDIVSLGSNVDLVFLARGSEDSGQLPTVRGVVFARMVAMNGPEPGAIQEIPKGTLTIGRSAVCNVVIESPAISKVHARFERTANQLVLTDLASSNGSFINSVRITSATVADGDVVVFGAVRDYRVDVQYGEITGTHAKGGTSGAHRFVPEEQTMMEDMSGWRARYDGTDEQPVVEVPVIKGIRRAVSPGDRPAGALEGTVQGLSVTRPAPQPPKPKTVEPPPPAREAASQVELRKSARTEPSVEAPVIRPAARTEPSLAAPDLPPPAPAVPLPAPVASELPPVTALVLTGEEETLTVAPGTHTLGRQDGCAIVVHRNKISRQHALLEVTAAGATVKDLASGNGTYLNDEKLGDGPVALKDGDLLRFAETAFKVTLGRS